MLPCPWCGQVAPLVWVHGHGQCTRCGMVTEECCRGERAEAVPPPEVTERSPSNGTLEARYRGS